MSRIGKKPIPLPAGVKYTVQGNTVLVEGPKGKLNAMLPAGITLEKQGDGFAITSVYLTLRARVPGADKAKFTELVAMAKAGCPVSKLLNAKITLEATLL